MITITIIKILNWNARGIRNKIEELSKRVYDYDIVIITETKRNNKEILKFKGYNVLEKKFIKKDKSAGKLAIIVRQDLKIRKLDEIVSLTNNIELLGVHITGLEKEINCIAIYRRPGNIESRKTWRDIVEKIKKLKNVMVIGDFNAHNTNWNCEYTDRNGERLQEEMEEEGFFAVNDKTKSRISEAGSIPSNLDLMFSSENIFELIDYKQKQDTWGSDHYPIEYMIKINIKKIKKEVID